MGSVFANRERELRYVGVICFMFSFSPTSTVWIYITKFVLHQQICNETYGKIILKIGLAVNFVMIVGGAFLWNT